MKSIFISLFLFSLVELAMLDMTISVQKLTPKGFRVKAKRIYRPIELTSPYPNFEIKRHVIFNVNITQTFEEEQNADFIARIAEQSGEWEWTYDNLNIRVENGWHIFYRVVLYDNNFNMEYKIRDINEGSFQINQLTDIIPFCQEEKCKQSKTTVRGQSVCEGELVFEEQFQSLDPKVWKIDARIPWNTEDFPFVSFQKDPQTVITHNGLLHVKPKLLLETPGFNESSMRTGTLKIDGCSGVGKECIRKATFSQILPPIISARIRTKHSFSFRYGKVVIRAKVPEGDWIVPMLFLEPLENFYGSSNYASGQIRIASVRGNRILQTVDGKDISNRYLSGGIVLEDVGPLQDASMRHYNCDENLSEDFHNFTLTWTEKSITVGIDGHAYGSIEGGFSKLFAYKNSNAWDSDSIMVPFDREFYFTIGLSVGGHTDFPDFCKSGKDGFMKPWNNTYPKAMLNFWDDRQNWMDSWKADSNLKVDFILVYAL